MKATGLRRHRKTQHGRKVRLVARKCEKKKKKSVEQRLIWKFLFSTIIDEENCRFSSLLFCFFQYIQIRPSGCKTRCPCPAVILLAKQTQPQLAVEGIRRDGSWIHADRWSTPSIWAAAITEFWRNGQQGVQI